MMTRTLGFASKLSHLLSANLAGLALILALVVIAPKPGEANEAIDMTAPPTVTPMWDCNRIPGPSGRELSLFLNAFCHEKAGWAKDHNARLAGPVTDRYYGAHGPVWARVYYSPHVYTWMLHGKPDDEPLPRGSMIVKEQYAYKTKLAGPGDIEGWTVMLKDPEAAHDGWIWAYIGYKDNQWDDARAFIPYCVACHASADNNELTFSHVQRLVGLGDEEGNWTAPWPIGTSGGTGTNPEELISEEDAGYGMHSGGTVPDEPSPENTDPGRPTLSEPLERANPFFLSQFPWSHRVAKANVKTFPPQSEDHVVPGAHGPGQFITSDVCGGCHDASSLIGNKTPDMMSYIGGNSYNLSPHGEWSASPMGLAGRDPIFHAQVEYERTLHPELSEIIDNTCFGCHGGMGQRQLAIDTADSEGGPRRFTHDIAYASGHHPDAKYGALARDGISCSICHHIPEEGLGDRESFTGKYRVGPPDEIYGPFEDPQTYSMKTAMGIEPKHSNHMRDAALCATCHMEIQAVLKVDKTYTEEEFNQAPRHHEQATYMEWKNSSYWSPEGLDQQETCQDCHMPKVVDDIPPFDQSNPLELKFRVANIQEPTYPPYLGQASDKDLDLKVRSPYARHTFLAANQFVLQMFQQFDDILGINPVSPNINRREQAVEALALSSRTGLHFAQSKSAKVSITSVERTTSSLRATVNVENTSGHKLPSGLPFRRAVLEFQVRDRSDRVIWSSGSPNAVGVVTNGDGQPLETEFSLTQWEPHHAEITRPDQAQIYEAKVLDNTGTLTTSFFSAYYKVKDNRLLPSGWRAAGTVPGITEEDHHEMTPCQAEVAKGDCVPLDDPLYQVGSGGADEVVYAIPLADIPNAASLWVRLYYQSIPPYYLRDRFEGANGPETQRLYHVTSHLRTEGLHIENWALTLASDQRTLD